jgi:outer membrane receptor for Fe3+-dicitrate
MVINEIRATEISMYPGMSRGYITVTSQVTDTVTGKNEFETVTVPAIEVGKRFHYNFSIVTKNGNVTEEFFFLNNSVVASRILGSADNFIKLWHAPKHFEEIQIIVLDR